ncbi:serine protease FAM111A-like [Astyanax mexicanus]|uniref:serine protease FAM111A-like n=1 Tax=Astyanax mexicanus TaxID=7994 RepID=UPI0020CAE988|nr:serine protease FAM111A-like [Astyanax mexicanus]
MFPQQIKEEEEQGHGKESQALKTEHLGHFFRFRHNFGKHIVTCNPSMNTVLEALCSNTKFRSIQDKNSQKELVIQREQVPRAAVNTDFPCCLIDRNELLDVSFIKSRESSSPAKKPVITSHSPENFCIFYIKTIGGTGIKLLMKNPELKRAVEKGVDYVCVYAIQGEKLRRALRRDGRFNPVIFRKHCALSEMGSEDITNMSNTVDHLDGKKYQVIVFDDQTASLESNQEFSQESDAANNEEPVDASAGSPRPEPANPEDQESADAQQQKPQPTVDGKKGKESHKKIQAKEIPNTGEILKLLREQFGGLVEQLKAREHLTKPAEVQKILREEYDKSAQSFSEVKRVKQLMELSNSVCQLRNEGSPLGTGFLLFDRFILTNAHVVGDLHPLTCKLQCSITAVFDFEDLDMGKKLAVKESVVALYYGKDQMGQHLDFALLELAEDAKPPNCQELLKNYSPPPIRGGICIIGHPDGGVKRMDPCFITEKDHLQQAENKHHQENREFLHVITQKCLKEEWEYHFTQISYDSCFFYGSSGSPVFNDNCQLIGVHTGGYTYQQGKKTRSMMEYAFPMLPILVCIVRQCRQTGRDDIVEEMFRKCSVKF